MLDTALFSHYLDKLAELDAFCEARNITLLVVPYPNLDAFSMKVTNQFTNPYLCNLIRERGIRCFDIFPALQHARLKTYTVNISDNHINAEASRVVADTLIRYIRDSRLLQ
jgi:hypothetical protein